MKIKLILVCSILMMSTLVLADDAPNGKDAFVTENAVNIPLGRMLLAKRNLEYCAVQFLTSRWSKDESSATYKSYYIPTPTTSFAHSQIKPTEDSVYEKQPQRVVGRFAAAQSQDKIFCKNIKLKWSGGPSESAWVYLDKNKTLELAPTKWRVIGDVNFSDTNLKWFKYGDVSSEKGYIRLPL